MNGSRFSDNQIVSILKEADAGAKLLSKLAAERGAPKRIYCDNGSEFAGRLVDLWAYANQVTLEFSRPGKPTDNAYIESFNGSLRDECLNVHWFDDLTDAKEKMQAWQRDYNESRPHRSLNNLSPLQYKARWTFNLSGSCAATVVDNVPGNPNSICRVESASTAPNRSDDYWQ